MTDNSPLSDSERAELERLRADAAARRPSGRARAVTAVVMIVVGCLLAPMSAIAIWTGNQLSDTDRYIATVAPLADDPAIQNAVANRTTTVIMRRLDVQHLLPQVVTALERRGLPPRLGDRLGGLAGPITGGVQGFVHDQTRQVVRSDAFANLWVKGNRLAHKQLTAVLSGNGTRLVKTDGGTVSLGLGPVVGAVKQRLIASGLGIASAVPAVHPTVTLFGGTALARAQQAYTLLNTLRWALPVVALALLTFGVLLARRRRRALLGAGLGVAAAMLVLGLGITLGRSVYANIVAAHHLDTAAATVLFDALLRFLRTGVRALFVVALVVAAGAYLAGPSPAAAAARAWATRSFARLRRTGEAHGLSTGSVGAWLHAHRRVLQVAATAVAAVTFLFWDHPTGKTVLLIAVILLAVLALIQLLARPPAKAPHPGIDDVGAPLVR